MCNCGQKGKTDKERLLGLAGLAVRAGKVIFGTPMVCDAMRAGKKIFLVLEACDCSENTHKRINDRCTYYRVPLRRIEAGTGELARALGKSGDLAVVAITDKGLASAMEGLFSPVT